MAQRKPVQIEVYRGETNVQQLAVGYHSVKKDSDTFVATAKVAGEGPAAFEVEDRWKISGAVLSFSRKMSVTSGGGQCRVLLRNPAHDRLRRSSGRMVTYFVPGLLYGDSSHASGRRASSVANDRAKRFSIREDYLSAPLFGVSFQDGNWAAVLDAAPRGDTTQAENTAPAATPIIDERIQFGALGARELSDGGIELGFWLPGTTSEIGGGRRGGEQ